jgi:DNA-binding PucR family transcriptional regulator
MRIKRLLGPVIAYDREHQTALLKSLEAFFAHDGRLEDSAHALRVHKNTLNYRLRHVERLTGKKLSRLSDLVDLWLAIRACQVVDGSISEQSLD